MKRETFLYNQLSEKGRENALRWALFDSFIGEKAARERVLLLADSLGVRIDFPSDEDTLLQIYDIKFLRFNKSPETTAEICLKKRSVVRGVVAHASRYLIKRETLGALPSTVLNTHKSVREAADRAWKERGKEIAEEFGDLLTDCLSDFYDLVALCPEIVAELLTKDGYVFSSNGKPSKSKTEAGIA